MANLRCTAEQAEEILKTLGKEDLLFSHHAVVMARPDAYERLAKLVVEVCGREMPRPAVAAPPRVYLAGPDVFFKNAKEHADGLKALCATYGLEGVFPLDADISFPRDMPGPGKAMLIFKANKGLIESCDGVLANMTPFRGPSADVGTGWEMGYAHGIGKPVVGYTQNARLYEDRVEPDEYEIEKFEGADNLMLTCSADALMLPSRDALLHPQHHTPERRAIAELAHILGTRPRSP